MARIVCVRVPFWCGIRTVPDSPLVVGAPVSDARAAVILARFSRAGADTACESIKIRTVSRIFRTYGRSQAD